MDQASRLAMQAIVRGLHSAHVLNKQAVIQIMTELQQTAVLLRDAGHQSDAADVIWLVSDIGKDAYIGD